MAQFIKNNPVFIIYPVVNDREFWAYWEKHAHFLEHNSPHEYAIFSTEDQTKKNSLKQKWSPAQELKLSLKEKEKIYRRVRFAELPLDIQESIQQKIKLKAQLRADYQSQSLDVLDFNFDLKANFKTLKRQYRQLALEYHPDQGGDPDTFLRLQRAYQDILRWRRWSD